MAFNNREYSQDGYEGDGGPAWAKATPATKWIIIVSIVVFFLQAMLISQSQEGGRTSLIEKWCYLDVAAVSHGEIWRLVTYPFCHFREDPFGFAISMLIVWTLGARLEGMYGSREFALIYVLSAVAYGLIATAFSFFIPMSAVIYGSTPCIAALFTLFVIHFPREELNFAFILPVQMWVLYSIYMACQVYIVLQAQMSGSVWRTIPYLGAVWAAGFAYLYHRFRWRFDTVIDALDPQSLRRRLRKLSTSRSLRVVRPDVGNDLDAQVDTILAKIHEKGSESLTERERAILQRASERAKNRS